MAVAARRVVGHATLGACSSSISDSRLGRPRADWPTALVTDGAQPPPPQISLSIPVQVFVLHQTKHRISRRSGNGGATPQRALENRVRVVGAATPPTARERRPSSRAGQRTSPPPAQPPRRQQPGGARSARQSSIAYRRLFSTAVLRLLSIADRDHARYSAPPESWMSRLLGLSPSPTRYVYVLSGLPAGADA